MARSVDEIYDSTVANVVAYFGSAGITIDSTTWSKRNIMRNMIYCFAVATAYTEQLQDQYFQKLENQMRVSSASSYLGIRHRFLNLFQYSATDPQYLVAATDGTYYYPVVNADLRIVTAASVKPGLPGNCKIKLARTVGGSLAKLDSTMVTAAQSFVDYCGAAGVNYVVSSGDADRMMIEAVIYYTGIYSATIQDNVKNAIANFFNYQALTYFDSDILLSDLEAIIKTVPGVRDVVLVNVKARAKTTTYADSTDLVVAQQTLVRKWVPVAGYVIAEDTSSHTLGDTLTFTAV
jgi:hypothetical protein